VKVVKLPEWKVSANVSVEDEEAFRVSSSDLVAEVIETAASAQLCEFLKISDVDAIFALHLVEECLHLRHLVASNDQHLLQILDLTAGLDVVFDDRHSPDGEKRLGNIQR
jgi:hypothetical protein